MLRPSSSLALALFLTVANALHAAPPVVSNVRASQRAGTGLVDILYDVVDADGDHLAVSAAVSLDGGSTWSTAPRSFSGPGYGQDITPGANRQIVWDAGADLDPLVWQRVKVKVTADDGFSPPPPEMVFVPPGQFQMGDTFSDGSPIERPLHVLYVSGFYMDKFEATSDFWREVYLWAVQNGYAFDNLGAGKGGSHPVQTVNWYDVVKWCNARSEYRGRTPVYYTDGSQTTIYKTGQFNLTNGCVKWSANGFRLPTEAEWEKAARGGAWGRRFPWNHTDNITHSLANYYSSTSYAYDTSPTRGYHPTHGTGGTPYTSPVGAFAANGYGLHDMAGNVWEWCWDWHQENWYSNAGATQNDSRGPPGTASFRVLRGGGAWNYAANNTRCAAREKYTPSDASGFSVGFRCVRGL